MSEQQKGQLVIIGGARIKRRMYYFETVSLLAGVEKPVLLCCLRPAPIADRDTIYASVYPLGAADVQVLALQTREEANQLHHHDTLVESTGIFFTGGDQLRITSILGGSILGSALQESYRRGIVIAGTSAGASVMSETMLVGGADDAAPSKEIIRMAPGLGLLKDVVVDQHFAQRGRIGRLLAMVAHNPYILGVGIDEDTAIVINNSAEFEVIGSGTVTVLDGREVTHSNVSDSSPQQPLALTNVKYIF